MVDRPIRPRATVDRGSGGQSLVAGERRGEGEECGEQPGAALVAAGEPAVAGQPGQRAFDDPAVPAELLAGLDAAAGDPGRDLPGTQPGPQMVVVVALVGVQPARS